MQFIAIATQVQSKNEDHMEHFNIVFVLLLVLARYTTEFVLQTDASYSAVGLRAVLDILLLMSVRVDSESQW